MTLHTINYITKELYSLGRIPRKERHESKQRTKRGKGWKQKTWKGEYGNYMHSIRLITAEQRYCWGKWRLVYYGIKDVCYLFERTYVDALNRHQESVNLGTVIDYELSSCIVFEMNTAHNSTHIYYVGTNITLVHCEVSSLSRFLGVIPTKMYILYLNLTLILLIKSYYASLNSCIAAYAICFNCLISKKWH